MVVEWKDILSTAINVLVITLIPMVIGALVPVVVGAWRRFAAKKPIFAIELRQFAEQAVAAAEQAGLSGQIEDKKDYAIQALVGMLKANGYNIDLAAIDAAIESAVWNEFNQYRG